MKAPKLAAAAFMALAVVACDTNEPAPTTRTDLDIFREATADLPTGTSNNLSDSELRELAEAICDLAGYADTVDELAILGLAIAEQDTGMSDTDIGRVMGAAIATHCPEEGHRIGLGR